MRLDRNVTSNGNGKYGLIKNRRLAEIRAWDGGEGEILDQRAVEDAIALLERAGVIEWGVAGTEHEFFVIKLKDRYAGSALRAYSGEAYRDGEDLYGADVDELAMRAGTNSPFCKKPD